jgi:hypothetical protein
MDGYAMTCCPLHSARTAYCLLRPIHCSLYTVCTLHPTITNPFPNTPIRYQVSGTLAHGVEGDVIGHDYFGTERVVQDLTRLPGWDAGLVTITPEDVMRDPVTTFITGIRIPCDTSPVGVCVRAGVGAGTGAHTNAGAAATMVA